MEAGGRELWRVGIWCMDSQDVRRGKAVTTAPSAGTTSSREFLRAGIGEASGLRIERPEVTISARIETSLA